MTEKEIIEYIEKAARDGKLSLDLSHKGLKSLPAEIGQLEKLTMLNLDDNKLSSLPAEIGQLKNLTELDISNNQLSTLPAEIGQLKNLTVLYLGGNQLSSLPAEIEQLTKLMVLYLSGNQLSELPAEIGQLKNLTTFSLSNNQLSELPAEMGQLTNLTRLDISDNQLSELPAEIGRLTNLKVLYLFLNKLSSLPAEIGQLKNLTAFYLSSNQLSELPAEIGQLKNLTVLDISDNQLSSLPAEMGQLTNLTALFLYKNQLSSLPAEIGQLEELKVLDLGVNLLISPPAEVVKQGTRAVLAYLRELKKGERRRYEAKLLILGGGGEGKTCVSRALRGLPFKHQVRTPGVEVVQYEFEHPDYQRDRDKRITLNVWDFEGQEINHQSHQFFLTEKSLYLLVINGRKPFELERAEYWLDTIRARAPGCRVILAASECENTTPSWPLDKLKANYGDLLQGENWYFAVGCESRKGIDDLAAEIKRAAADMELMGIGWPVSYQKAEDEIRKRANTNAQVKRAVLYEIFSKSGIDKENFESAARQMAVLGVITQFADSPEMGDFVVLNPQWLTKGISLVMEDKQLEEDKGEIGHERMKRIWDSGYSGLYPTLHSCMKEFELCYDMEDDEGCLVPLRFGDARPEIPWSEIPAAKERRVEYKLSIQPPAGIMSRFIVKTHYMIAKTAEMPQGVYWHNGVFLRTGEGEYTSEALCEFDRNNRTLRITVRAAFPQNMTEQLHGFAKAVFSFFEGLKPERYYGCVKSEDGEESQCAGIHTEKRITYLLSKKKKLDCEFEYHETDPLLLVTGINSFGESSALEERLRRMLQQEMNREPEWAKKFGKGIHSVLVRVYEVTREISKIKVIGEKVPAELGQRLEQSQREMLELFSEMLDNRDFNSAPAVISIAPVDGSKFNPKNWFNKKYAVKPYCEYEGEMHEVNFSVEFEKPREWWEKAAPKLALGLKVLSAGVQIFCAGLPVGIDAKVFEAVKNEAEFMKELASHLELEGGAESDISERGGDFAEGIAGKGKLLDLRQRSGEDEKRIVRAQLAELLSEIAPANYKAQQWGKLRRMRMPDNTYRWLCAEHLKRCGK